MKTDPHKRRALFLNMECINTLNEGPLLQHAAYGCPKPKWSKHLSFLRSKIFAELTRPKLLTHKTCQMMNADSQMQIEDDPPKSYPKMHTIVSTECNSYFDWQTVGLVHSFHQSGQPGNITRLLSCTDEELKQYKGYHLAPTHYVPSMSRHPLTGDCYLIGCDNELAKLHTRYPEACDKVGGVIIMHINDLRKFALLWLYETVEVRADTSHWSKNITGGV